MKLGIAVKKNLCSMDEPLPTKNFETSPIVNTNYNENNCQITRNYTQLSPPHGPPSAKEEFGDKVGSAEKKYE